MAEFENFRPLSQMSFTPNMPNIATGNTMIDQVISLLLSGSGVAPRAVKGQSVMESYMQRERSNSFLQTMRSTFGSQLVAQKLGGINTNSAFGGIMSMFLGQPDGLMNSSIMRAFNGGNPVKAQMALLANMTGMNQYMATGHIGNASFKDVMQAGEGITQSSFHTKVISDKDVNEMSHTKSKEMMEFANGDKDRRKRFDAFITKDADGSEHIDFNKLEKIREAARTGAKKTKSKVDEIYETEVAKVYAASDSINSVKGRVGQVIATSLNFETTRGFEIQDLTKSYTEARALNMYDERGTREAVRAEELRKGFKGDNSQVYSASAYGDKAGGVLRAYADMAGTETAEDSVKGLHEFFSSHTDHEDGQRTYSGSNINIGGVGDSSGYAEDLMRRTKGVARTANISMEAMLGVIQQTKNLAAQHPEMQYLGGAGAIEQTLKSFTNTQVLAAQMGSNAVRRAGGFQQMVQEQNKMDMNNKAEPISSQLYAMRGFIDNSENLSDTEKERQRAMLREYAAGRDGGFDPAGQQQFFTKMGAANGRTFAEWTRIGDDTNLNKLGIENEGQDEQMGRVSTNLGKAGQSAKTDRINNYVTLVAASQIAHEKAAGVESSFFNLKGERTTDLVEIQDKIKSDLVNTRGPNAKYKDATSVFAGNGGLSLRGFFDMPQDKYDEMMSNYTRSAYEDTTEFKEQKIILEGIHKKYAKDETQMARDQAKMQAPIGTVLAQELFSNLGKSYNDFIANLTQPGSQARASSILESTQRMNQEHTTQTTQDLFYEIHGGANGLSDDKVRENLAKQGLTPDEINAHIAQRDANTDENRDAFTKAGAKDLTLNQIYSSVAGSTEEAARKSYAGSKAKAQGMSFEEAKAAAAYGGSSLGLTGDKLKKYGSLNISPKVLEGILTSQAVESAAAMFDQNVIAQGGAKAAVKIEDILTGMESGKEVGNQEQAKKMRAALKKGGYAGEDGKIDGVAIAEGYRQNVDKSLTERLIDKGYITVDKEGNKILDEKKLTAAVAGGGASDKETARMLLNDKQAVGDKGIITNLDTGKLYKKIKRDEANESLKGTLIDSTLESTAKLRDASNQKKDEFNGAVNLAKDDAQLKVLQDIQSALGTSGAGSMGSALAEIATALSSLVGLRP